MRIAAQASLVVYSTDIAEELRVRPRTGPRAVKRGGPPSRRQHVMMQPNQSVGWEAGWVHS